MVDVTGDFNFGPVITCILREGDVTVNTSGSFGVGGLKGPAITVASEVSKDEYVQLDVDALNTYLATGGLPVLEKVASTGGVSGRVVQVPEWNNVPSASETDWSVLLAGGFYRIANIELVGMTGPHDVSIIGDTSNAVLPGETDTFKYDVSAGEFETAASGGTGGIALHAVGANDSTGTRLLIGLTGGPFVSKA